METKQNSCCEPLVKKDTGVFKGILYSLFPHAFCIAFVIFSVIGSVAATSVMKEFLVIPYFFTFLVVISFLLATLSAFIYLKRAKCLCFSGLKSKWKYLTTLYLTMILINVAMFTLVFPALANINSGSILSSGVYSANTSIVVKIPCSGHASLIIDELKKNNLIGQVTFRMPNIFDIEYDSSKTSLEEIIAMDIFKTFPAIIK
ncbi:MAG: hypothetical protein NTW11_01895 [Candidatus Staskawiczbacteria bacterium]|nr:hypothetical protein [Candidatus Staskawiczbacteria bacterium]